MTPISLATPYVLVFMSSLFVGYSTVLYIRYNLSKVVKVVT